MKLLATKGAEFTPSEVLIDDGRAILKKTTVWEMAKKDKKLFCALALPWSPASHCNQPPCVRVSISWYLKIICF